MRQYLDLLKTIKAEGTYKPAARENMPGTQSLFGYQFRHNLADGFPLLTTKKISFKNVVTELLWFLRGDTNIKYLVDNGCNIWNEDAYNYYLKKCREQRMDMALSFKNFILHIKGEQNEICGMLELPNNYILGDCGFQYGRVWREWEKPIKLKSDPNPLSGVDQIKTLIEGLKNNPESRRHIVTAIDPAHDQDLALYWCHAMFQFNCRPLTQEEKIQWVLINTDVELENLDIYEEILKPSTPKYYLDCQLYQRSADSVLGVPYNIASYALLTHIIAEICNMVPGEFIHSFGDVHIYDNHKEAVAEQLTREPKELPQLVFSEEFHHLCDNINRTDVTVKESVQWLLESIPQWNIDLFALENYNPAPSIKAELSTGLKK